ncbi:hypothetical protein D3C71_958650 [compost metagenome]
MDAAQRMVAGVGHVQHVAHQRQPLRPVESSLAETTIDHVRAAQAKLPQHAAGMVAFENAVMAGVGHVQALSGDHQATREQQRQARLGVDLTAAEALLVQRTLLALTEPVEGALQLAGGAYQALLLDAPGVQQHQRRPRLHVELPPRIPVRIQHDGRAHALPAQQLQRLLRFTLELETRHLNDHQMQPPGIAGLPARHLGDTLHAPDRGAVDESQHHRSPAQLLQGGRCRVEPDAGLGQFHRAFFVHVGIMPESSRRNRRCTVARAAASTSAQLCSKSASPP